MKKVLITSGILVAAFAIAGVVGYNSVEMEDIKENVIFTAEAKEAVITSSETTETAPVVEAAPVVEPVEAIEQVAEQVQEEAVEEEPEHIIDLEASKERIRNNFVVRETN